MINPYKLGRLNYKDWRNFPDHYTEPLWPAELPSSPKNYGDNEFHGRTHPEIVKVALERYTKPGDIAWDVMAGSGTVADVCAEYEVQCISTDINPTRDDIKEADVRWMGLNEYVDIAFLHPPYMNAIDYDIEYDDAVHYKKFMNPVISNITNSLKLEHVLVVIAGSVYDKYDMSDDFKSIIPLDCIFYDMLQHEYRLIGRVFREFGETKGGQVNKGNKQSNLWKVRNLRAGTFGLGLDCVMFWQRVE